MRGERTAPPAGWVVANVRRAFEAPALWVLIGTLATGLPRPAAAQVSIAAQASRAEKTDYGIGARAILDLGPFDAGLRLVGSFDLFFPGSGLLRDIAADEEVSPTPLAGDVDYWEANLNAHYTLGLPLIPLKPYVGGGINLARTEVRNSTDGLLDREVTDRGINLLAGAELDVGGVSPFFELRYEISGGGQWVMTGGLIF